MLERDGPAVGSLRIATRSRSALSRGINRALPSRKIARSGHAGAASRSASVVIGGLGATFPTSLPRHSGDLVWISGLDVPHGLQDQPAGAGVRGRERPEMGLEILAAVGIAAVVLAGASMRVVKQY